MTTELRERLEAALGHAYSIERELGGGGMSRVFVAEETGLGRPLARSAGRIWVTGSRAPE